MKTDEYISKKQRIIEEVDKKQRLIGDVSEEFGVPRRTIYQWLREEKMSPAKRKAKLDIQLKLLQQELRQLGRETYTPA